MIVEAAKESVKLIRENVKNCQVECQVVQSDAIGYLQRGEQFDLIFIDPPYDSDLVEKALKTIKEFDILSEGGIIICEARLDKALPVLEAPYILHKDYHYGKIKLTVYTKET